MNIPEPAPVTGRSFDLVTWLDRRILWLSRHWLLVFNLFVFIYVGLPFAAPALMATGATGPARVIYTLYSPLCHQFAFRSWFLFGEQPAYPREAAGTSLENFGAATGIDESDIWAARAFRGNEKVGYKVAYCERDVAIYGGILLAGLAYGVLRRRFTIKPLHWFWWGLIGLGPIALDGFSQLLSQPPYSLLPWYRESTPLLRTLTGALFGIMNTWLAYPYLEETMVETEDVLAAKIARTEAETNKNLPV